MWDKACSKQAVWKSRFFLVLCVPVAPSTVSLSSRPATREGASLWKRHLLLMFLVLIMEIAVPTQSILFSKIFSSILEWSICKESTSYQLGSRCWVWKETFPPFILVFFPVMQQKIGEHICYDYWYYLLRNFTKKMCFNSRVMWGGIALGLARWVFKAPLKKLIH